MGISPQGWRDLKALPKVVKAMIIDATETETIDILGEVREVEKKLASERKMAMSEIPKGSEGEDWWVKQGRKCNRTYNDSQLLIKVADAKDMTPIQAIGFLLNNRILTIEWRWTELKELIHELKLETLIANRPILAGDQADIGEDWVDDYASLEPVRDRSSKPKYEHGR